MLWAHVLTSVVANLVSIAIVIGVALIMGFRTGASVAVWLAVAGILILFTLALTWLAVIAGLSAKTVDGASAFAYPLVLLGQRQEVSSDVVPARAGHASRFSNQWLAYGSSSVSRVRLCRASSCQRNRRATATDARL